MLVSLSLLNGLQKTQINSLRNFSSYPIILKNVDKTEAFKLQEILDKSIFVDYVRIYKNSDLFQDWVLTKGESGAFVLKKIDRYDNTFSWTNVVDVGIRCDEKNQEDLIKEIKNLGNYTITSYIEENKDFYDALKIESFVLKIIFMILFFICFLNFFKNINFIYSTLHPNIVFLYITSLSKMNIFKLLFKTSIIPNLISIIFGNIFGLLFTSLNFFKKIVSKLIFTYDSYLNIKFYTNLKQILFTNIFIILLFIVMLYITVRKHLTLDIHELYND